MNSEVKTNLDLLVDRYNQPSFIPLDPISVPHRFTEQQDIEIAGFVAAIFAWGLRKTIINKANEFIKLMDEAPLDFVLHHKEKDLKPFTRFKHRTFQPTDALYLISFLQRHFQEHASLESAFVPLQFNTMESSLSYFRHYFFNDPFAPKRTRKHISSPVNGSTCKRLNMFLRWMVRKDKKGVDFGIWEKIKPRDLMIPLDVHVERVARSLGLLQRRQRDWKSVVELTNALREFAPDDPVRYDYALFGIGVMDKKA